MGYSDLGCYGSEIATPHLDRLAAGGLRYTQMYNTSKCWTTRISLLTGRYHIRSGRDFANTALAGEVLRPAGYRTWWSGKHHATFNPHTRGFDHFSGFLGGAINFWNPGDKARPGEATPAYGAVHTWAFDAKEIRPFTPGKDFHATDAFTDWSLAWLSEDRGDAPFFLYLAYNAPHWPLHARPADIERFKGKYDAGYEAIRKARYQRQIDSGLFDPATTPLSPPEHAAWGSLSSTQRVEEARRMEIHAAMVHQIDRNVGRLVAALEQAGELDNTLILFLVDNGASHERPNKKGAAEASKNRANWGAVGSFEAIGKNWANVVNAPLRRWKISPEEGGICTPMIAHWPDGIDTAAAAASGGICREPCHLIDLLPTWMELAGPRASYPGESKLKPGPMDGMSIAPTFRGQTLKRDAPLFFEYGGKKVVRDGPWKAVQPKKGRWALYHLGQDRTETEDRAASEAERLANMSSAWHAWYTECTGEVMQVVPEKQKRSKTKK